MNAQSNVYTQNTKPYLIPTLIGSFLAVTLSGVSSQALAANDHPIVHMTKRNASGFALDGNWGGKNGQLIYLWKANTNNINQQWYEIDRGNGFFSYQKVGTNHCLDGMKGGTRRQGIHLWSCSSSNYNQHWKKVNVGSDHFRLQKRNASRYSLDGRNDNYNGSNTHLWDSSNSNYNQHWKFTYINNDSNQLDSSKSPSSNFDLSQWKLTLPESKDSYYGDGGSSAAEVMPKNCNDSSDIKPLDNGYNDMGLFYTGSDGSMVFETPLIGGGGTPNTSYVRSELRELYNWQACESDSAANWSPVGRHELSATLAVTEYYNSDPQTVVGQIHAKDSKQALLKLQWDGPTKDIRAILNKSPDEKSSFSLDFGLTPNTEKWSYKIVQDGDKLSISVTHDGQTVTKSVTFGSNGMSSSWRNHEYYFKAGNYAQADKNSGGNFIVKFYDLNVKHD